METKFYLWINEAASGPHQVREVIGMLNSGVVNWETLAHTGNNEWKRLGEYLAVIGGEWAAVFEESSHRQKRYNRCWRWMASGGLLASGVTFFAGTALGSGWLQGISGGFLVAAWGFWVMDRLDLIAERLKHKV